MSKIKNPLFGSELSPGQLAVRSHVSALSAEWNEDQDNRKKIYRELHKLCLTDPVILNDSLLTQNISDSPFTLVTLEYLQNHSKKSVSRQPLKISERTYFIYSRGDELQGEYRDGRLIYGGVKWDTTFECLMALGNGEYLSTVGWGLSYYPNEGILCIDGGGNHRTLAHLIYGKYDLELDTHEIYDTQKLPIDIMKFNEAINLLQKVAIGTKLNVTRDSQDILDLYHFANVAPKDFCEIYSDFSKDEVRDYRFNPRTLSEVMRDLEIFEEWSQQNFLQKMFRKFTGRSPNNFAEFLYKL